MKYYTLLFTFFLLLTNCNSVNAVNSNNKEAQDTSKLNGTYMVTNLYGKDVSEYKLTMIFDTSKNSISGFSGCNSYTCDYIADKNSLNTGFPIGTKIYCEETSNVEKEFFKVFAEEKYKNLEGNTLNLTNHKGITILSAKKKL
ncbi:META domain-containing protein [uncultured Aquimarina sp.]|uniref:META domain-containing protein n=1 Tax=uncultured Aquimarina sp. TaxID=575652 RepID=UPI00262739BB|nr:META domain-containing protein [uncultured Aquimarina sp.]